MSDKKGNKNKQEKLETMRHSASHVMAQAVLKLFPDAKLGIGPAIENGFYYDFDLPRPLKEEDLPKIEAEMKKIIKADLPFEQKFMSREETEEYFKKSGQNYKADLLKDIPDKKISFYVTGSDDFMDMCRGPHLERTGQIGAVKLDRIAGAYWRGDENKPMLQRIYALAFENQKELDDFVELQEKLKAVDHRILGKQMDLFSFHEESPGNAFWHPRGLAIINRLIEYWREVHYAKGYVEVRTPVLMTKEVWKRSGHLDNYAEKIYLAKTFDSDDYNYAVKPMNCNGGMLIYNTRQHSYKELPLRVGEIGVVNRYESSGETHGLLRVREFTQDDAHIFCTPEQTKSELKEVIHLCLDFYKTFGLEVHHIELSTRPEKSIGSDEVWETAEKIMKEVLKEEGIVSKINEGDGAFYGPKFDFHLADSMGRTWQCGTIQLDFAQPENFNLEYTDESGEKQRPIMIHRVVYGSIERFLGILIENYGGVFPLWLAPEQVRVIPISDKHEKYSHEAKQRLEKNGISVTVDSRSETMQSRIRNAEIEKIPYVLVVGDKEEENGTVSVRPHGKKDTGMVDLDEFITSIKKEIETKENGGK
ncbi:threonine--tRNA ligase [Candidatus Dojkabacteria bacterium]|nr:threonine--tRNA ligase [Candidatus Dojkabacteria bacterium]